MKNKIKKVLISIFTMAIVLQPFTSLAHAWTSDGQPERTDILTTSEYMPWSYSAHGASNGGSKTSRFGQMQKLYLGGKVVFCVEPWNDAVAGTSGYMAKRFANYEKRLGYIAYHGYLTHQTDDWYMASQLMIWEELGWTIDSTDLPYYDSMKAYINDKANHHADAPSWQDKTYNYNKQIEFTDPLNSEFHVVGADANGNLPNGMIVKRVADTFYINKGTSVAGNQNVEFAKYTDFCDNTADIYYDAEGTPNSQSVAPLYLNDPIDFNITIRIPSPKGDWKLYKSDDNGKPVQGVKFKYGKDLNGTPDSDDGYWIGTTDANGIIVSKDWANGTKIYYQEISAPSNLIVDPTIKSFIIKGNDVVEVSAINKIKKEDLLITKVDEKGKKIPNTTFKVSRNANMSSPIGSYTTTSNGSVLLPNLTEGAYYVQEISAPSNLVVDNTIYKVDLVYGKIATFTSHNKFKRGKIILDKHDLDTNNTLKDVTFELATDKAFTNIINTKVTDAKGIVEFDNLVMGKYFVREKGTPTGYITSNEVFEFDLVNDKQVVSKKVTNTPIKAQVTIKKQAELLSRYEFRATEQGKMFEPIYQVGLLKDVTYNIVANEDIILADGTKAYTNGEVVETLTTNAIQPVVSSKIPLGKYYLVETQTAPGYVLDSTHYEFELKAKDTVTEIVTHLEEHKNDKQKATITLDKTIEDSIFLDKNETVKDITFGLYVAEDILNEKKEVILSKDSLLAVSNLTNLKATFNVDLEGKYYVRELTTNANYVLDTTKHYFDYLYKGNKLETLTFNEGSKVFENKLKRTKVEITKKSENEELLKGVEYSISDKSDMSNILGTAITDDNGKIVFDGLELGNYFIKETKALEGYIIDKKIYPVVADEDATNDNYTFINYLKRISIKVKKVDSVTKKVLVNCEFTLYDESGTILEVAKTDANGIAMFKDIAYGFKGYIMETKAPVGYKISKEKIQIAYDDKTKINDNQQFVIEVENVMLPAILTSVGNSTNELSLIALLSCVMLITLKKKNEVKE
ncbi:MAG: SpaA isopeptide-forming pilin-related protein [Erysipelotrichaceae bacterium]